MHDEAENSFRILPKFLITATMSFFDKIAISISTWNVSPNFISTLGLFFGAAVGYFFYMNKPLWAGVFVILCGISDILDGRVAVRSNRQTLFGAIYDSSLDRYSEFLMYLGLAFHFRSHWGLWLVFLTILGSTMVSYTRARAEGLGIQCRVGIMQRAERILILAAAAFIGAIFKIFDAAVLAGLVLIAVVSNISAVQRIYHVSQIEKARRIHNPNINKSEKEA